MIKDYWTVKELDDNDDNFDEILKERNVVFEEDEYIDLKNRISVEKLK